MIVRRGSILPIDFAGLRIFDYTAGHELRSSLAVIEVPPGARHAEAWSKRSDEYHLVVDGAPADLAAGDFCLVRQGQRFSYVNPTTNGARLVLVHTPDFELTQELFVGES